MLDKKRFEYEASLKRNDKAAPVDNSHKRKIDQIDISYTISSGVKEFSFTYLEDLMFFLKGLNPSLLKQVKLNTAGVLEIHGIGTGITGKIL